MRRKRSRARVVFIVAGCVFQQATPATLAAGFGVLVLGRLLQVWSYGHLDKASRTNPHRPDTVTTSGPYAFVRNPIMLGSSISDVGFLILAGNPILLGIYIITILPLHVSRVIRLEEPHLREAYGEAYDRYRAAVPRFIPRPWPWSGRQMRRWSFLLLLRNRELSRTCNYLFLGWVPVLLSHAGTIPYPPHLLWQNLRTCLATPLVVPAGVTGALALASSALQAIRARRDAAAGDPRVRHQLRP